MAPTADGTAGGTGKSRLTRRAGRAASPGASPGANPGANPGARPEAEPARAAGPAPAGAATRRGRSVARQDAARQDAGRPDAADPAAPTPPPGPLPPPPSSRTSGPAPASPAGPPAGAGSDGRPAMDALASRQVPRNVPPPPGGPLPTTRRGMLRYRVLPRSVIGVSMLILAFAIGAGFSGVVLYSYYQYKQDQADTRVNALINGYKSQFAKAEADLHAAVGSAKADIAQQLKGAEALQSGPAELATLTKQVAPSVFFVHTLDAAGQPSVGSAFVIASTSSSSLLLTSYTTVAAATHAPGPPVYVRQGGVDTAVTVRTWDPQNDLALLVLAKGGLTPLTVAPATPTPQPGDRLFAVSGLGAAGASLTQGSVVDVSSSLVAIDTPIGTAFQGGPLVDRSGNVVAVASRTYAPLGFTSDGVYYAPYVQAACSKVLSCPGGTLSSSR